MGTGTLPTLFPDAFAAYEQTHPLPPHVRRAARALMQCRTAALGGHLQAWPDGHVARVWSNSCRQRSCPQGASLQTARGLAVHRARLLACAQAHGLFTLPPDLTSLWLANVAGLTTLLLQARRDPLGTRLADPPSLGAPPGSLAALHPWSPPLVLPPHVHCLVTGGGLTSDGPWQAVRTGLLVPVRVGMAGWRGTWRAAIRQALAGEALVVPEDGRPPPRLNLLTRLGHPRKPPWHVHIRERSRPGAGVVTSLARSLRGGPSQPARLVAWDGARGPCPWRPRQAEADGGSASPPRLTLSVADLLQRWRLHGPVPQTRVVRSYGLSPPTPAAALAVCRTALGQPPVEVPVALDGQTVWAHRGDLHPARCPACGQLLVCPGVIPRGGAPPSVPCGAQAA